MKILLFIQYYAVFLQNNLNEIIRGINFLFKKLMKEQIS